MTNNNLEVLKPALDADALKKAAHRIMSYDGGVRVMFEQQMGYVYLAGMELNVIKDNVPHGEFEKFVKEYLPKLSKPSRCRYMAFETRFKPQMSHSDTFAAVKLLEAGKELPAEMRESIGKAVYKEADGKTLTEMYRDLGVIKNKEHQKHTPAKKPTPEEALKAKREAAVAVFDRAIAALRDATAEAALWNEHATKAKREELRDACLIYTTALKKK